MESQSVRKRNDFTVQHRHSCWWDVFLMPKHDSRSLCTAFRSPSFFHHTHGQTRNRKRRRTRSQQQWKGGCCCNLLHWRELLCVKVKSVRRFVSDSQLLQTAAEALLVVGGRKKHLGTRDALIPPFPPYSFPTRRVFANGKTLLASFHPTATARISPSLLLVASTEPSTNVITNPFEDESKRAIAVQQRWLDFKSELCLEEVAYQLNKQTTKN